MCDSFTGQRRLWAPEAVIFRMAPAVAGQHPCLRTDPPGARCCHALEADVVPFPTLASVRQLYHLDPELSIYKYHSSKSAIERNTPRAYPMRQSGCRRPPPGSPAARSSPARAPIPSATVAIRPHAIDTNRRLSRGRQRQGWRAKPPCAHSRFGSRAPSIDLKPLRLPIFGRDMSKALSGSSCATAKRSRKSSPACRIPAVIEPRRSITASVSTTR